MILVVHLSVLTLLSELSDRVNSSARIQYLIQLNIVVLCAAEPTFLSGPSRYESL